VRQPESAVPDQDTVAQVCRITAELMGANVADIKPSTSLADLGADELDMVELIMELEEHFGVSIPDEAITDLTGDDDWQVGIDRLTMSKLAEIVERQKR
jgi:acyl carrier protein